MARRVWLIVLALLVPATLSSSLPRYSAQAEDKPAKKSAKPAASPDDTDAEKTAREKADLEYYELYKVLSETMFQVEQNYVQDIDRRELMEAAIRGVLEKLDPYSNYISPDEMNRFRTSVESQFGGIGIQITMDRGQLKVLSPLVGTPAYRAGLRAGDSIVEINGKSTEGFRIDEAVKQLKGEAGTSVDLKIIHPGESAPEAVTLNREVIHVETVLGDQRKSSDDSWDYMYDHDKKIGYIRITAFSRETADDVEAAVKELKQQGLRGLIIDLRFNPGGLLKSATDIADMFVSEGTIVTTRGRNTKPREITAHKPGTYEGFPMAILVNRYSASASEIVSACLQDHKRAVVIGERTWGKGSVQNVIDLEGGRSALKLTTASYWRPSGHNIHRFPDSKETDEWGVMPDKGYEIKLNEMDMAELLDHRRDRDILLVSHAPAVIKGQKKAAAKDEESPAPKAEDKSKDQSSAKDKATEKPADKTAKPAEKTAKSKAAKDKAKEKPAPEETAQEPPAKSAPTKDKFVDKQLQKALDFLTTELAKAE